MGVRRKPGAGSGGFVSSLQVMGGAECRDSPGKITASRDHSPREPSPILSYCVMGSPSRLLEAICRPRNGPPRRTAPRGAAAPAAHFVPHQCNWQLQRDSAQPSRCPPRRPAQYEETGAGESEMRWSAGILFTSPLHSCHSSSPKGHSRFTLQRSDSSPAAVFWGSSTNPGRSTA